ncbi:hypothetical protein VTK26DRAFT_8159 [Humicola hyalothermophila]
MQSAGLSITLFFYSAAWRILLPATWRGNAKHGKPRVPRVRVLLRARHADRDPDEDKDQHNKGRGQAWAGAGHPLPFRA